MPSEVIPGLGPQDLEGAGSGSGAIISIPPEIYQTPLLDISIPFAGMELVQARPGYIPFAQLSGFWVIESVIGTQVTPATFRAGSDAGRINYIPLAAQPSNTAVNTAQPPAITSAVVGAAVTVQLLPNVPIFMDLVSGASGTGGFKCMARFVLPIFWFAA